MPGFHEYSITPLGDSALLLSYGNAFSEEANRHIVSIYQQLKGDDAFVDLVPAYTSIGIIYDQGKKLPGEGSTHSKMKKLVGEKLKGATREGHVKIRQVRIPVCYDDQYALDMSLFISKGLTKEEVISMHCSKTYTVFVLGFLPGFAYMGMVDERLSLPRKQSPRPVVEKGSVAIAAGQTGIYPVSSPGGWNIIGRTPVKMFDPDLDQPSFLQAGDQVTFYPITIHEFEDH